MNALPDPPLPPQAPEVERTVLGSMIIDRKAAAKGMELLREGDFYSGAHKKIFITMQEMHEKGTPIDLVTLDEMLSKKKWLESVGDSPYLAEIAECLSSANIEHHIKILQEKTSRRQLIEAGEKLQSSAYDDDENAYKLIEEAEKSLCQIKEASAPAEIYSPNWKNRPGIIEPVLKLAGEPILHVGNISVLIACPGAGKSAICEAVAASSINPECDSLGLSLCPNCHIAYSDTERAPVDHWNGWHRMARRAEVKENDLVPVTFESLKMLRTNQERRRYIERSISSGIYNLIIIDGIGDLVRSVNDEIEAGEIVSNLLALATRFNIAILTTIHHNPQPGNDKARGWLGSEVMRKAESVLKVNLDRETEQRTLTTDFNFGKVRNASGKLESCFAWDEGASMFLSCENAISGRKPASDERYYKIAEAMRSIKQQWTYAELVMKSAEIDGKPGQESVGVGIYRRLKNRRLIAKDSNGLWVVVANQ